jgi:propionyl-CoA synthetase
VTSFAEIDRGADADQVAFWSSAAKGLHWIRKPVLVLDEENLPRFSDGVLNTCFNALDRHVALGRADETAMIGTSAVSGEKRSFSYAEFTELTAKFAGLLRALGVGKGDPVMSYLPVVAEAAITMLACARIGAELSVISGELTATQLAHRVNAVRPKVVVSVSTSIEAVNHCASQPDRWVIVQRAGVEPMRNDGLLDYRTLMRSSAIQPTECVGVMATDLLYVGYRTGSTDGLALYNGEHAVALHWAMTNVQHIGPGDVVSSPGNTDCLAWPSYRVFGPLLVGATPVLEQTAD